MTTKIMNWVETQAIEDERFRKHGAEAWRVLRDSFRSDIDRYNKLFGNTGPIAAHNNCGAHDSERCLRVRMVPMSNQEERYVELRFEPEMRAIAIRYVCCSPSSEMPELIKFGAVLNLTINGQDVTAEGVSRIVLEPLFFPAGVRPYPSHPPER